MTQANPSQVPAQDELAAQDAPPVTLKIRESETRRPVRIWGLPLLPVTYQQTLAEVAKLIQLRRPSLFITANLQYAMLSDQTPALREVNQRAAFLVADGMPMVWYSRLRRTPLPERVAGSDLIYGLCEQAAACGHRVFFLGGVPGVAEEASQKLCSLYPDLQIAGIEVPPFRQVSEEEETAMIERIRSAKADLLLAALGQPKGELWLDRHLEALNVPACVQVGATFDFVTGRIPRAPRWIQKIGLEWAYRICQEPRRMAPRYFRNGLFLAKALLRDAVRSEGVKV